MKLALISDIHGNLEALTEVLKDIEKQKVDRIHCLGDVIGYGGDPVACVHLIEKNCDIKLIGNHEFAVLGLVSTESYNFAAQAATEWTTEQMTDVELAIISDYEMMRPVGDTLMVHASPHEPDRWHYLLSPESGADAFAATDKRICFHGHTHVPMIFVERQNDLPGVKAGHDFLPSEENRHLINTGSVGQPRDNNPRACYLTFDTDEYEIKFHRVEYDIATAQGKMAQANLPEMLISRLSSGR